MEGDYLAPKPAETELPKFEENLSTPEFVEETTHESFQTKPALAGLVATENLKHNPNPEIRRMATEETPEMDPEMLLKQVQEAADQDQALEGTFERSHERKDDPIAAQQDNSAAKTRTVTDVPNEPIVAVMPIPEHESAAQPATNTAQEYQEYFSQQRPVSLYKQAFVVGVTTALAILAIFITIKLT